jgi:hypothetical protein
MRLGTFLPVFAGLIMFFPGERAHAVTTQECGPLTTASVIAVGRIGTKSAVKPKSTDITHTLKQGGTDPGCRRVTFVSKAFLPETAGVTLWFDLPVAALCSELVTSYGNFGVGERQPKIDWEIFV